MLSTLNIALVGAVLGILSGFVFGLTGVSVTGFVIIILDYLGAAPYKTIIGTLLFINLFPLTGASVFEYYKAKQINFLLGCVLYVTVVLGGWFGARFSVSSEGLTNKQIKYVSAAVNVLLAILFFNDGYHDKS